MDIVYHYSSEQRLLPKYTWRWTWHGLELLLSFLYIFSRIKGIPPLDSENDMGIGVNVNIYMLLMLKGFLQTFA